jgi:aspartate racemase
LESYGADLIAIPCNTAHLFWRELSNATKIPILNIVEETIDEIEKSFSGQPVKIAVLSTMGTVKSALYQKALARRGFVPMIPSDNTQRAVHGAINSVKAQVERESAKRIVESAVQTIREDGADGVILGCTELALVGDLDVGIPVFDSLVILVKATLREALEGDGVAG